jgi:hypothetical protein
VQQLSYPFASALHIHRRASIRWISRVRSNEREGIEPRPDVPSTCRCEGSW